MPAKYQQLLDSLMELICQSIENGVNRLPTESELCASYKVSRQTVRLALSILEKDGIIEKRRGSGSYITGHFKNPSRNTVGILISSDSDYIYPALLSDISASLMQQHFTPQVYVTDGDTFTERKILTRLLDAPPRGLIVEGCKSALPSPNLDVYEKLKRKGVHFVFLHNYYGNPGDCTCIMDDNPGGSLMLVNELIKNGHTAIGGIFQADELSGIERYQGFMETMRSELLPVPDRRVGWFRLDELAGLRRHHDTSFLQKIASEHLRDCSAVICHNNEIAYFLAQILKKMSLSIPEDMTIAAFDDTYLAAFDDTPFLTLSHTPHEMGQRAAESIINELRGIRTFSAELGWQLKEYRA